MRVTMDPLHVTDTSFFQLAGGSALSERSSDAELHLGPNGMAAFISLAHAHSELHPPMLKLSAFSVCEVAIKGVRNNVALTEKTNF